MDRDIHEFLLSQSRVNPVQLFQVAKTLAAYVEEQRDPDVIEVAASSRVSQRVTAAVIAMFESAGLDIDAFTAVDPRTTPPVFADELSAWEGSFPERPEIPIRVDAASLRGRCASDTAITNPDREKPQWHGGRCRW